MEGDNPRGLLRGGLKALGNVRDDVVMHQANVIETLLGLGKGGGLSGGEAAAPRGFPGLDIGLRRFVNVFYQRVAAAVAAFRLLR